MKKTFILTAATLLTIFTSCEMKEELLGKNDSSKTGGLELTLSVPEQVTNTRAVSAVSTDDFGVSITGTDNTYDYPAFSEMENPLFLPVGDYTVTAHSAGEIQTIMPEPYYGGEAQLTISQGITSQATVTCKMKNTLINLNYGDDFKDLFKTWTIQFNDGKDHILTFTDTSASSFYWYIAETQATTLTMDVSATKTDGTPIHVQKSFSKADANEHYDDDTDYFTGGDKLDINIGIEESGEQPGEENGNIIFDIQVNITFDGQDETVEIPVEDVTGGNDEPQQPGGGDEDEGEDKGAPTMTMPSDGHITYTINGNDQPASADVIINVPNGLQSMVVKIVAGNELFGTTISDLSGMGLDFVNGVEMVGNTTIGSVLSAFLGGASVSAPATGDTTYTFPVGAFFSLMNNFGATTPKAHTFQINLEDQKGNKIEDELQVTINPAADSE